jgi:hypothetical protein
MSSLPRRPEPAVTLESMGIFKGSGWLATEEEQAEIDRIEAERLAAKNAEMHALLDSATGCRACGTGNGWGHPLGLCPACAVVVADLRAQRARDEVIGGHSRQEWCLAYIDRQTAERRTA